jgi:hypothetical protein
MKARHHVPVAMILQRDMAQIEPLMRVEDDVVAIVDDVERDPELREAPEERSAVDLCLEPLRLCGRLLRPGQAGRKPEAERANLAAFERLRKAEATGRPMGSDSFMKQIEDATGRVLKAGKRGRKKRELSALSP